MSVADRRDCELAATGLAKEFYATTPGRLARVLVECEKAGQIGAGAPKRGSRSKAPRRDVV